MHTDFDRHKQEVREVMFQMLATAEAGQKRAARRISVLKWATGIICALVFLLGLWLRQQ